MQFFIKLVPIRPTFAQDMSPEERAIMGQHAAYWTRHMQDGNVHVFGPVLDPAGVYGIGILEAEDEAQARSFTAADPAVSVMSHYEITPMQATVPGARP